jgi:hypothetical protein
LPPIDAKELRKRRVRSSASQHYSVAQLPDVLVLHFQRTRWDAACIAGPIKVRGQVGAKSQPPVVMLLFQRTRWDPTCIAGPIKLRGQVGAKSQPPVVMLLFQRTRWDAACIAGPIKVRGQVGATSQPRRTALSQQAHGAGRAYQGKSRISRVGQNHISTVYIRYVW